MGTMASRAIRGLGVVGPIVAWILGPLLIGFGLIAWGTSLAVPALLLGVFVTPRTREEIRELCAIWVAT